MKLVSRHHSHVRIELLAGERWFAAPCASRTFLTPASGFAQMIINYSDGRGLGASAHAVLDTVRGDTFEGRCFGNEAGIVREG